ncbi:substrate-binding domain-containing protein [Kitasatospora sp. NPDC057015]|uniref:substrate-binding domain-containing protein n=1 Tax=Kitasatospora sp. NPDC057015 TaxID=3346001 RepID=UPI00363A49BE
MRTTASRLLGAVALATALVSGVTVDAVADPPALPPATAVVGFGGQTTQGVLDRFSTDYNAYLAGLGDTTSPRLYNWDSEGSAQLTTKVGATQLSRPGVAVSVLALDQYTHFTVDFVRVEALPADLPGYVVPDATFVRFAKDAVSWSAPAGGNAPANLTAADLRNIYSGVYTTWNQITDIPGYVGPNSVIKPYLPQVGSGIRAVFLKAIGSPLLSPAVVAATDDNEGTAPVFSDPDVIFPYSVGHWIGQVYGGHTTTADAPGPLTVRAVNGVAPLTAAHTINPTFANATFTYGAFGRYVHNVVRAAEWSATDAHGIALRSVFGPNGWICTNGAADVQSYGFLALPANACGTVSPH